jgi:NADPH2:quinone reductase
MKAIGFKTSLPKTDENSLIEFEIEKPVPTGQDLLVRVLAVSVNPVDYKVRKNSLKDKTQDYPKIIGWDAVGVVEAVGDTVSLFKEGHVVFYAGDINRSGSNQEYQLVDERIVGFAPEKLPIEAAAAMPLTSLTAYEILFDRLRLSRDRDQGKSVLIIGGAGGVGSIAIQLAKKLLGLTVIATASRPSSAQWCTDLGADFVVNHTNLIEEMTSIGHAEVDIILDFVDVNQYWDAFVTLIKPQGQIGSISDPSAPVNLRQLKSKSVSFHWELMFTRPMFYTSDMIRQQEILNIISELLDNGTLQSTLTTTLKGFTAANLQQAHQLLESGKTIGKVVVAFEEGN